MEKQEASRHRRVQVRTRILLDHLEDLARRTNDETLRRTLTVVSCWDRLSPPWTAEEGFGDFLRSLPGGLTEDHLHRFASIPVDLAGGIEDQLISALDRTLMDVTSFYNGDEELSQQELTERSRRLPEDLLIHLQRLCVDEEELSSRQDRIVALVEEIHQAHPRLHAKLLKLLSEFSTPMRNKHAATYDLLATKIETLLIKLSLIRAKAHTELYGFHSPKHPDTTMEKALLAAHERYSAEERRLAEEERQLDKQLSEYRQLLELVDGKSKDGGFAQVVDDWVRVQKETEECKRDLRRLGWTGD